MGSSAPAVVRRGRLLYLLHGFEDHLIVSEAENPQRQRESHETTIDDVRQLMGASTPHFALQLRERIRALIRGLPPDHPARVEGEREIARLDRLAYAGEVPGPSRRGGPRAAPERGSRGSAPEHGRRRVRA